MSMAREVSKMGVNTFGCLQKSTFGIDLVLNQVQKLFEEKQYAAPNACVLPHGCLAYLALW